MNQKKQIINDHFAVIGGDKRSIATANQLETLGYSVSVFGFNPDIVVNNGIERASSLQEALTDANYIILPLPCDIDNDKVNTPLYNEIVLLHDLIEMVKENQIVFAGKMNKLMAAELEIRNIPYFDYTKRDEFAVLNAIPTAEGAIEIALRELPITLNGAQCLVLGFGRIAKALSHYLNGLGSHVTVAARRQSHIASTKTFGYSSLNIYHLPHSINQFQVIFNTIPFQILDRKTLQNVAKDCLIIDLASKPAGWMIILEKIPYFLEKIFTFF